MADSDLLITISGAALSLLLYENVRSSGDQMGLLLGDTLEFAVKSYTDSDNQIETVKIHNNIETVVTCPLPDLLHNSIGRINKEKLKEFMHDKSKQVIGWFRFRRNAGLVPTMRDKTLHREFSSYFSEANGSKKEFFITCLLNASVSSKGGTHKFKHVFLRSKNGKFEPVPLRINNLGYNMLLQDSSDYKATPIRKSSDIPDIFTKFVDSLNLNLTRTSGHEAASIIQEAAEQYLNQLIPELCQSDLEVAELEKQIKELKQCQKAKINGTSNNTNQNNNLENELGTQELQRSEKVLPPMTETSEDVYESSQIFNDCSSASSQTRNQGKSRRANVAVTNNSKQESPPANSVSEMKVDVVESAASKNSRFCNKESEIIKELICTSETNETGVGRGKGRITHDSHQGLKKARKTSGPIATRSNSERTSHTQVSQ